MGFRSTLSFSLIFLTLLGLVISDDYCMYTIFVKTGTKDYAGTDAKISVLFFDEKGHNIKIDDLQRDGIMGSGHDYFEKGNLDMFRDRELCVPAPICRMQLTSDNSWLGAGWYVDYVEIISTTPGLAACIDTQFTVDKWLATDEWPYSLTTIVDNCDNEGNNDKLQHPNKTISAYPSKTVSTHPNKTVSTYPNKTVSP